MNIQTLLENAHYAPVRPTPTGAMYRAKYRGDTNASLSVDYDKNVFFDFGTGSGGDVADLYRLLYGCSIGDALRAVRVGERSIAPTAPKVPQIARKCPIEVTAYREIRPTDATAKYLTEQRGLTYWAHLYHVNYTNAGKPFFGIGWRAIDGGWHIRSLGKSKFCTSQQISLIKRGSDKHLIFEGMLDYLSLCQLFPAYRNYDAIVLNSVTNANKTIEMLKEYKIIHLLLDKDKAGDTTTAILLGALPQAKDNRGFFASHNDINEYLQHKLNLKQQDNEKTINDNEKDLCKQWVSRFCEATKGISRRFDSYNLKHFVEGWCNEYVSNESFIAACEDLQIRMKPTDESGRNCYFAIKVKPDGVCNRH